jgi:hypothetical protein
LSATSPSAASEGSPRALSRELGLLLCALALVLRLALTALLSRMYRKEVHTLADAMFAPGEADEQAQHMLEGRARAAQLKAPLADSRNAPA